MPDKLTADQVHAQMADLRSRDARIPVKVELGQSQRDAIEAQVKDQSGLRDIGPLREYNGLEIVNSRKVDHLALVFDEDSRGPETLSVEEAFAEAPQPEPEPGSSAD